MLLPPQERRKLKLSAEQSHPEQRIEILEVFAGIPDKRQAKGKRHQVTLCLALFTLAIVAGNRGFLAIGDWLTSYWVICHGCSHFYPLGDSLILRASAFREVNKDRRLPKGPQFVSCRCMFLR